MYTTSIRKIKEKFYQSPYFTDTSRNLIFTISNYDRLVTLMKCMLHCFGSVQALLCTGSNAKLPWLFGGKACYTYTFLSLNKSVMLYIYAFYLQRVQLIIFITSVQNVSEKDSLLVTTYVRNFLFLCFYLYVFLFDLYIKQTSTKNKLHPSLSLSVVCCTRMKLVFDNFLHIILERISFCQEDLISDLCDLFAMRLLTLNVCMLIFYK